MNITGIQNGYIHLKINYRWIFERNKAMHYYCILMMVEFKEIFIRLQLLTRNYNWTSGMIKFN